MEIIPPGKDGQLVMLVEDNENDQQLAMRALKNSNITCRVELANDGQEALDYLLDAGKELPDLVLLDLKMPRVNGKEVLKRVRSEERTRRCPIVVFTSSGEQTDVLGCFDSGANSFVKKAIEYDQYMARLKLVAEYWLTVNEPC